MIRVSTWRAPTPADPLDRQVLDRAQQLGLRRRRQVRDLVQEQRALVRVLELAAPAAHTGRGAILDAEQLRLEQGLDDRGAVHRDERPLAPATEIVNLARHQLLARARLPLDEHREVGRGHPLDALAHRRIAALDPISGAAPSRRDARELRRPAERPLNLEHQRGHVRRRLEQLAGPAIERAPRHRRSPRAARTATADDRRDLEAITLPAAAAAGDPSQTATARARTIDRSSRSKRSRTDDGPAEAPAH